MIFCGPFFCPNVVNVTKSPRLRFRLFLWSVPIPLDISAVLETRNPEPSPVTKFHQIK